QHSEEVPCHYIRLNEQGDTIEDLERQDNEAKLERELKHWLRGKIHQLEEDRAKNEVRTEESNPR
ncbi:MAG TPA: hypothetical protein VJ180_15975, partial [Pyrinomonadaceae bacterium]|nr:hypothetical protein [Pyrinomonadaceae bacterium]